MARLYFLSDLNSDISAPGDFSKELLPNISNSLATLSTTVAGNSSESAYGVAEPLDPGSAGSVTGNYTFSVNCTTAGTNMVVGFRVARINSAGTLQTESALSTEVSLATTGVKTATLTSINLGTFTSTDRLRVTYAFRNTGTGNRTAAIECNSVNTYVITPFREKYFVTT
jgi:hypothetical protein